MNENQLIDKIKEKKQEQNKDIKEIEIPSGPTFYSVADENMFFNALNSIPAVLDIKGKESYHRKCFLNDNFFYF